MYLFTPLPSYITKSTELQAVNLSRFVKFSIKNPFFFFLKIVCINTDCTLIFMICFDL